ncbi:hypothetical protein [Vibrio sp. Hal054]|uniref:hypothetical protein n=1 Tax=Vibrio sp. Hal054 TaxID=3035158 RepID=UPI00301D4FD6
MNITYNAISDEEVFAKRVENDFIFSLAKLYPFGNVITAQDVLDIEMISGQETKEQINAQLKAKLQVLQERSIKAHAKRERQQAETIDKPQGGQTDASQKISILY